MSDLHPIDEIAVLRAYEQIARTHGLDPDDHRGKFAWMLTNDVSPAEYNDLLRRYREQKKRDVAGGRGGYLGDEPE